MTADGPPTTRDAHDSAATAETAGAKLDPVQVRTRMKDGGVEWALVPPDLRDALRLPWLLDLYLRLAGSDPGWRPKREYELFERAWQGEFHAVERAPLERAALLLLPSRSPQPPFQGLPPSQESRANVAGDTGYPWSTATLDRAGATGADRARWTTKGWLRQTADACWEIPHQRLLNWLVASALVDRWSANRNDDALIQPVAAQFHDADASSAERFGYVAMDVLWLLCAQTGEGQPEVAGRLLAALDTQSSWERTDALYEHWLPTLGGRVIPALKERLCNASGQQAYLLPGAAAKTVIAVAQREPQTAQAAAEALRDREGPVQDWAVAVLRRFPRPELLPRLWSLFVMRRLEFRRERDSGRFWRQNAAFTALEACARRDPQWIERQFRVTADPDQFADLCRLLAGLDSAMAHPTWLEIRECAQRVLAAQPRRLIEVMATVRDAADMGYLERCCASEDAFLAAAAATAFARVTPEPALDSLDEKSPRDLVRLGEGWLAELGSYERDRVATALQRKLGAAGGDFWELAAVVARSGLATTAAVDLMLDRVAVDLPAVLQFAQPPEAPWDRRFEALAGAASRRLDLRARCELRADSLLDLGLAQLAVAWMHEVHLFAYRQVEAMLQMIGGGGLNRLVEQALTRSEQPWILTGLQLAVRCRPTDALLRLLHRHALTVPADANLEHRAQGAVMALAALGAERELVDGVLHLGLKNPRALEDWRRDAEPMASHAVMPALTRLRDGDAADQPAAIYALGLSGRAEFVPLIQDAWERADPGSDCALAALVALHILSATDERTLRLAQRDFLAGFHRNRATELLVRIGTTAAIEMLAAHQRQRAGGALADLDLWLLSVLQELDAGSAEEWACRIWEHVRAQQADWLWIHYLDQLAPLRHDPDVHSFLEERAFRDDPERFWHGGSKVAAVRAFRSVDCAAAFRAAQLALASAHHERDRFAHLLVDHDPGEAVPALGEQLKREHQVRVRWAIAAALRCVTSREDVQAGLARLLGSRSPRVRFVAAEALSLQEPGMLADELRVAGRDDPNPRVRWAARAALTNQDAQRQVAHIVVEFQNASEQRRWGLLDALFDLAPDDLLICSGDPLGLRSLWERATPAQRERSRDRLSKLPKMIDDAATTTDKKMHDWFNWDEIQRPFVFVCYSRDDQRWTDKLLGRLVPLEREGRLEAWHDRDIEPGGLWRQAIEESIKKATVGILLVSPGFAKSRFIQEIELPRLWARAMTESLALLPVLVERAFPKQTDDRPAWYDELQRAVQWFCRDRPLCEMPDAEQARAIEAFGNFVMQRAW